MKLSRRRFLGHLFGASMATTASFAAYRTWVPSTPEIIVDYPGMALGHAMRDGLPLNQDNIPTKKVSAIIIGSGAAGLSAAWQLSKQGLHDYVVLNGPERNGNNRGESHLNVHYPTGAHYLPLPSLQSTHITELLQDLGIFKQGQWDESALVHAPSERLYYQEHWQEHMLPATSADSERFFQYAQQLHLSQGQDGRPLFAIPLVASSTDATWRKLDDMLFATWLQQQGYADERLLWYLDYCCRDDYGQGIHQVSAWAGLHYFCARSNSDEHHQVLTWPDGLNHLSEGMRRYCRLQEQTNIASFRPPQQQAVALNASALRIEETNHSVKVLVHDGQQWLWLEAPMAICAMPLYIAARVVANMEQYGFDTTEHMPAYAPWLVSNFILKEFPHEAMGTPLAWDNVAYQGQGLGFVVSTHQQIRRGLAPYTSFTAYTALNHGSPSEMRYWLMSSSAQTIYQHAAAELESIYGLQLRKHMVQARITVRGHAMAAPTPQFLSNAGIQALRSHTGRLRFAHSDLSGYSIFEEASWWGHQQALSAFKQWL